MAAPMKSHARVCLTFDNEEIENSWFLVKYNEMPLISDIIRKINDYYLNITHRKKHLVLRLQSSILPDWECSEIIQDNDRITVSVEKVYSTRSKEIELKDETNTTVRKKRKRKETVSEESDEHKSKEKKQKCKETSSCTLYHEDKLDVQSITQTIVSTEPAQTELLNSGSNPVSAEVKDTLQVLSEGDEVNLDESVSDVNATTKKRKRIRKHRKRKSKQLEEGYRDNAMNTCTSNFYKGREIGKDELFFGSMPDKLVDPKHYRHGYNNLKVYQPEPNKHTKFDSEEEANEREHIEQYNFLSSTKLLEEREAYKDAKENPELNKSVLTSDNELSTKKREENGQTEKQYANISGQNNANVENDKHSKMVTDSNLDMSVTNNDVDMTNGYHSDTVHTNTYTAQPFKYPSSEPRPFRKDSNPVPSQLTRKTLASGVSVFVRQRPGRQQQQSNQLEMSKADQLNTVATNVSTIFVNPNKHKPETAEPVTEKQSRVEHNGDSQLWQMTPAVSSNGALDYSKLPPLKGEPKKGDKIIYKVLEISETCTPEISEYRKALVLRVDKNQMVELKNMDGAREAKKTIFHVELEDEHEVLTNTETSQEVVQLHLSSLLEPRIMAS